MNRTPTPDTLTGSELYALWMESPHATKPGLTNAQRSVTDQLTHRRGLECFAAGVSDGERGLDELLARELDVVAILSAATSSTAEDRRRSGRAAPIEKTLKNYISCSKALQALALGGKDPCQAGKSGSSSAPLPPQAPGPSALLTEGLGRGTLRGVGALRRVEDEAGAHACRRQTLPQAAMPAGDDGGAA